jgi:hypothetical protein
MNETDQCAFEKKVIANDEVYGDFHSYIRVFSALISCMKETNKLHERSCEFFRLTFRPSNISDNSGMSPFVFEMRWGNKSEGDK